MRSLATALFLLLAACRSSIPTKAVAPAVDDHQHLVSRAFAPIVKSPERDGAALLRELDAAGVMRVRT
jgi:hypothetical protein